MSSQNRQMFRVFQGAVFGENKGFLHLQTQIILNKTFIFLNKIFAFLHY